MMSAKEVISIAFQLLGFPYKWNGDFTGEEDRVTPENVAAWHRADPYHFSAAKCSTLLHEFLGRLAGDCSGLITHCLGIVKTRSADLWAMCVDKHKITDINAIPKDAGLILYRLGHIGLGTGDGNVIEAGSTDHGVTCTPFAKPQTGIPWTYYGYLKKHIDYTVPGCPYKKPTGLYADNVPFSGEDALWIKWHLLAKGYTNITPGNPDFGPEAWKDTHEVQQKALGHTGDIGPKTIAALES